MTGKLLLTAACGLLITALPASAQSFFRKQPSPPAASVNERTVHLKKAGPMLPDSSLYYEWDNNQFDSIYYSIFTYDVNGNVILEVEKGVQGNLLSRYTQTYNANGKNTLFLKEKYDQAKAAYVPQYKYESRYDNNGNKVSEKEFDYDTLSQTYELSYGDSGLYAFDGSDRVSQQTILTWDPQNQLWVNNSKLDFVYNGTDTTPSMLTFYHWENIQSIWLEYEKLEQARWGLGYNGFGINSYGFNDEFIDPTGGLGYEFHNNNWVPVYYDSSVIVNNRIVSNHQFEWDGTNLDSSSRAFYTYDAQDNQFSEIHEVYHNNEWTKNHGFKDSAIYGPDGEILVSFHSNYFPDYWSSESKYKNFFSSPSSATKISKPTLLKVYPNPATDIFTIENPGYEPAEVKIYTLQGAQVLGLSLAQGANTIDVSGWDKGVYFIRLQSAGGISTQKVVIR